MYARPVGTAAWQAFPLAADDRVEEGRYTVELPASVAGTAGGFEYYAELRNRAGTGCR